MLPLGVILTALKHAKELLDHGKIKARFLEPKNVTASTLPDISTSFDFMCCPGSISDLSSKIGLGYIGPRVRRIVNSGRFPVLITSPVFKKWRSIAVFFGGSANAINALKLGFRISRASEMPLSVYTHMENVSKESYEEIIKNENLEEEMDRYVTEWHMFERGRFEENIFDRVHSINEMIFVTVYGCQFTVHSSRLIKT